MSIYIYIDYNIISYEKFDFDYLQIRHLILLYFYEKYLPQIVFDVIYKQMLENIVHVGFTII